MSYDKKPITISVYVHATNMPLQQDKGPDWIEVKFRALELTQEKRRSWKRVTQNFE